MIGDVDVVQDNSKFTESEAKRHKSSHFENCIIMHSVLHDRNR